MGFDRLTKADREVMARRLKAARYTAGLTLRATADALEAHTASVTQWETGTVPVAETRTRLAELYGIDETVLFAEIEANRQAAEALLSTP